MILTDGAAAQPSEVKTLQVKSESISRGSFQRILQKEIKQSQQTKAPPPAEGGQPDVIFADAQIQTTTQDTAGKNPPPEVMTAEVLTMPRPALEEASAGKAEPVTASFPAAGLEAELTDELQIATTQSPQTVSFDQEIMEPSEGQTLAGRGQRDQASLVKLAHNQASTKVVQSSTPATTNSIGGISGSADAFIGVQLGANQPEQTAARPTGQGASSTDSQSTPLLSIVSKTGEMQNSEEPQSKTENQGPKTARDLAELESRKLTGQKAQVIQPSSAAEHNQIGRESRSDHTYQAVRPEGLTVRSPELNSLVTNKTAGFDSDVDAQEVLNQIVRKAELMVKSNNSQMKIELYPEFLGKLTIKVMVEEGAVTARFITDNHQVKQMLEANLGMLRQSLESQGMRVERAEVDVQLSNGGLFDGSHQQREWNWDSRYFQNHAETSLTNQDPNQIAQELLPMESATYEAYGIGPNGSLDFVI